LVTLSTSRTRPKPFTWSYSKLKNYETCPKRYFNIDVEKKYKEDDEAGHLGYGQLVHTSLADAINHERKTLPEQVKHLQPWVDKVLGGAKGTILVEQQMAITASLTKASSWFGEDVWYRGIGDVVKIVGPVAMVIDWKTGKILEDGIQLALMAQCVFAHHPEVQKIKTRFVWLKEDATTDALFTREDMVGVWAGLLPRVTTLKNAHEQMNFPPTPNGLCKRFCIVTGCPHQGV
jgi:hypothetical protein